MPRMPFRRSSARTSSGRRLIIFLSTFFILIALVVWTPARNTLFGAQSSLYRLGQSISSTWNRIVTSPDSTESLLAVCETSLADLAIDAAHISELEREIAELEEALLYSSSVSLHTSTARVLATSTSSAHELFIDRGQDAGISVGNAVVANEGHLIGLVSNTTETSAHVTLLSSEESTVGASLVATQETIGLVEGEGGFLFHLNFVPQDISLEAGELLVTSRAEEGIPAGLVIGQIEDVTKEETALFQEATVKPLVDASSFSYVVILLGEKEND